MARRPLLVHNFSEEMDDKETLEAPNAVSYHRTSKSDVSYRALTCTCLLEILTCFALEDQVGACEIFQNEPNRIIKTFNFAPFLEV